MAADWLVEENERAQANLDNNQTENAEAPKMVMVKSQRVKKPKRVQRGLFAQPKIWEEYDKAVFKMKGKISSPELAEEALQYIINKYKKGKVND